MSATGKCISIDRVTTKAGDGAWQVVTDYAERDADGLCQCAIWLPRPGPVPAIGDTLAWGHSLLRGDYALWNGERHKRLGFAFDPNDPALWTG